MKRKKEKLALHHRIHHHIKKHFHKHVHKAMHVADHVHHFLFHGLELVVVAIVTLSSFGFTNLTGLNQDLYTNSASETAEHLLAAMQEPGKSLKQGNIISIWSMDTSVENTFTKGYCTYGAARISPEFFPYINDTTQQRTRGGNAVDRCKNASETGYKIGTTPAQGALVIYDAGGKFGAYGHVGKVLHYDKSLKKIIVRDMARIAKGTMSDRWEDLTTAQVKCYIYNNKTTTPTGPIISTGTISIPVNTGTTPTTPVIPTTPTIPTTPVIPTTPTQPVVTPTIPVVTPPIIETENINKKLILDLDTLSDIAEHFLTQNDLVIKLVSTSPLKLGDVATLTLEIINKNTGEKYSDLLPFRFGIISTNDSLQASASDVKFINEGKIDISILAQKLGTSTIIITMDGEKISSFTLEVK